MLRKLAKKIYYFLLGLIYTKPSFVLYRKQFLEVPNSEDIDLENQYYKGNLIKLEKPITYYQNKLLEIIQNKILEKKGYAIVRASDGEAYFLKKQAKGNIIRRHYTKSVDLKNINVELFKQGLLDCDLRLGEMYKNNRRMFQKIYNKEIFSDIPFEAVYALAASRKIFQKPWRMGIIGSENKIKIIKKLFEHKEYQEYIRRNGFEDYIGVPEIGAANDPIGLTEQISLQIKKDIDVYLVGIGIAKLAILPILKKRHRNVFFDIGAGISALAGMVGRERAYFASWKNFYLKNFDYSQVDMMDLPAQGGTIINL